MTRDVPGPAEPVGPVLLGVHGTAAAEEALRYAFAEADHRGVGLVAVLTGAVPREDTECPSDLVRRWAEKYPEVPATITIRRGIDPAVVIAAASHGCGLLVLQQPSDPVAAALAEALIRRAHCPVVVATEAAAVIPAAAELPHDSRGERHPEPRLVAGPLVPRSDLVRQRDGRYLPGTIGPVRTGAGRAVMGRDDS